MASYTPNLNLYKPDATDDYEDFLTEFNSNMDKIDQGGGSTYTAGDGIDITSDVISLAYLKVVDGAVNLVFDE